MLIVKNYKSSENVLSNRFEFQYGVAFWVRPLTGTIMRELRKKCVKGTKVEYNSRTRQMETVEDIDGEKYNDLLTDYILDKWIGLGGEDHKPLPINLESKKLILDYPIYSEFIFAAAKNLDTSEAEAKNLQTSPAS